jgi:hypothetical protein
MRRQDVQDGALCVQQVKTGTNVQIELIGPLAAVVSGLAESNVSSVFLIHNKRGQPFTLAALRKRFDKLVCDWQLRDLRAQTASDSATSRRSCSVTPRRQLRMATFGSASGCL